MRLIDADALIDRLTERKKREQGIRNIADILNVQTFIDSQPTAYDIEKVVEELEALVKEYDERIERRNDKCYFDESEKVKALQERALGVERAIEIVKQGGVADDVCEWKLTKPRTFMPYKTSCGNDDLYDSHYKYCPYCSKKIKVVE